MSRNIKEFKEKLESNHSFPGLYVFKFIVPNDRVEDVKSLGLIGQINSKSSSKGTYVSITINARVNTADEVVHIYERANEIKGLMAL